MSSMFLYHGTSESAAQNIIQRDILLTVGRKNIDFGQGFYLAKVRKSAITWATRHGRRYHENGVLLYYTLDLNDLNAIFFKADGKWIGEIISQRTLSGGHNDADVITGPIADNTDIMLNIQLYQSSKLTLKNLINKLMAVNLGLQFVIKSEKAKNKLTFHKSEVVYYDQS